MLGARVRVEEGEDVAAVVIRVARELGTTYVLLGTPRKRRGLGRLAQRDSLLMRLLDGLPGVDVRIGADPTLRRPRELGEPAAAEGSRTVGGEQAPREAATPADMAP